MNEVTESMFNGLGERVTRNKDDFIACRAENTQKISSMEEAIRDFKSDMKALSTLQTDLGLKLGNLTGKIVGGCGVISFIAVFLAVWIEKLLK
jgi:hypothetical protein